MSQRDLEKETALNISKKMKHIIISYAQGCKAVGLKGKTEQTFPIFKPAFQLKLAGSQLLGTPVYVL